MENNRIVYQSIQIAVNNGFALVFTFFAVN